MPTPITYHLQKPTADLAHFVDSFWMLRNDGEDRKLVSLPDGRVDLIFYQQQHEPVQTVLIGIETQASHTILPAKTALLAISCKLPATEYLFPQQVAGLLNSAALMPASFWDFTAAYYADFNLFCETFSKKIKALLPATMDSRKQQLFSLVYASNGAVTVKELAEKVYWSSRQINRYFRQQWGIGLKAYCDILRFRASFTHLSQGRLFPEQDFADQNHFIKTTKRYAGVTPKVLHKNDGDQYFYLTTLQQSRK